MLSLDETQNLSIKVAVLQQNVDNFRNVFDRLDTAIEKITEVSGDIRRMLAVHEEQIDTLGKRVSLNKDNISELNVHINAVNRDVSKGIHEMEVRILKSNNEIEKRIIESQEGLKKNFIASQEGLKNHFVQNQKGIETRVKVLESWRYVVAGMAMMVGFIATIIGRNWEAFFH